jgi:hypothetical protein
MRREGEGLYEGSARLGSVTERRRERKNVLGRRLVMQEKATEGG